MSRSVPVIALIATVVVSAVVQTVLIPRVKIGSTSPVDTSTAANSDAGGLLLDEIHWKEATLSQATLTVLAPFRARPSDDSGGRGRPSALTPTPR